ncbi:MAG: carbohydrate ABC transporter permease [Eubacteriales bacterium]|nr:carbohydrate ABC transporter permease [Eubacteriales bacterium]
MKIKKKSSRILVCGLLLTVAMLYILPLLLIVTNSFMSPREIFRHYSDSYDAFEAAREGLHCVEYRLVPDRITLEQYDTLLLKTPVYLDLFLNSLKLTLPTVAMQLVLGATAGYGFTVWRSKWREPLFCLYIIVMVLPFQATLVANYLTADILKLVNTHWSIILPLGFSPLPVFIMRQSMKGIPVSVLEAARMDGCSHWQLFFRVAAPMCRGALMSVLILGFADCWAMVEQPLIFLKDTALEPLSVTLSEISRGDMGLIFAASVFYMPPVVWLFLYGQDAFEKGIRLSALR